MKLAELDPSLVRYERRYVDGVWGEYLPRVESVAEAQGLMFQCPACFRRNGGPVGTHYIEVSFAGRGVADNQGSHNRSGQPVRWSVSGTGFADLTTTPSILIDPCPPAREGDPPVCEGWHGFITNGGIP